MPGGDRRGLLLLDVTDFQVHQSGPRGWVTRSRTGSGMLEAETREANLTPVRPWHEFCVVSRRGRTRRSRPPNACAAGWAMSRGSQTTGGRAGTAGDVEITAYELPRSGRRRRDVPAEVLVARTGLRKGRSSGGAPMTEARISRTPSSRRRCGVGADEPDTFVVARQAYFRRWSAQLSPDKRLSTQPHRHYGGTGTSRGGADDPARRRTHGIASRS